jgi:hypothetical protein
LFANAAGSSLRADTIVTKNGDRFEDARITTVTPATLTIFHRSGIATVPLWELPLEIQQRYHYSEVDARAWLAAQAEQQLREAIAAEKARQDQAAAAERAKQEWRAKEAALKARVEEVRALADYVYDPATQRWYPSQETAWEAREQALRAALEARWWDETPSSRPVFLIDILLCDRHLATHAVRERKRKKIL